MLVRHQRSRSLAACLLLAGGALTGCEKDPADLTVIPQMTGADAKHGEALIRSYGCGSCHTVPGMDDAKGLVGPPLTQFARRVYVAGVLRNVPDNLTAWLTNPQAIVPGNAMPNLGVSEGDARDMAAYLYTLE
jgi:cytochrome c2